MGAGLAYAGVGAARPRAIRRGARGAPAQPRAGAVALALRVGRLRWREFLAGELSLERGDVSLALEHLERAHRADPEDAAPLIYAALAAMARDRAQAEALLRRATACTAGARGRAWSDLADCLRSLGRFGEARDGYRRALELAPDDASLELRLRDVERYSW